MRARGPHARVGELCIVALPLAILSYTVCSRFGMVKAHLPSSASIFVFVFDCEGVLCCDMTHAPCNLT